MDEFEIAVVGSGPCGASFAAHLAQIDPGLLDRTVFLDKSRHPRPKVCGGGITRPGQEVMAALDFEVDFPVCVVDKVRLRFEDKEIRYSLPRLGIIAVRDEMDASLVAQARARGMRLQEDCEVKALQREAKGIHLETSQGPIRAKIVVGADGSNSFVRRKMQVGATPTKTGAASRICRLLKTLTPEDATTQHAFVENEFLFDFTRVPAGVQGYYWEFPSFVDGKATMNRGIVDSRLRAERPRCDLKGQLRDAMAEKGRVLDESTLVGAPLRWYDRDAPLSEPGLMLAGDAAGAEPLFAEGITFALMYGKLAAEYLHRSVARQDGELAGWSDVVRKSPVGKQLHGRRVAAQFLYGQRGSTFLRFSWPILNALWGPLGKIMFPHSAQLPLFTEGSGHRRSA